MFFFDLVAGFLSLDVLRVPSFTVNVIMHRAIVYVDFRGVFLLGGLFLCFDSRSATLQKMASI